MAHKINFGDPLDERAKQLFGEDYKEKFGVSKLKLGSSIGKNGIATASGDVYTHDKNSEYSAYQYSIDFYDSKGWNSNEFYDLQKQYNLNCSYDYQNIPGFPIP